MFELRTGKLSLPQLTLMLTHLPVDLTFVDADGFVRFYSDSPERIFPRSPAVIGRHVEKCHPPKSLDKVMQIASSFKNGEKDVAEFWIQMNERFIYIRYFAVRDDAGEYVGTLEVSQDVTEIRKLQGERRLLDWEPQV
jgi:PAS domain S-box-containing protein